MKYYEISFRLTPNTDVARDILSALSAEAGLESFIDTDDGLKGYAQQQQFGRDELDAILDAFPIPGVQIAYTMADAEDKDWNATWEADGFTPIVIEGKCVVHSAENDNVPDVPYDIKINPQLAFGTGHHQTTRMLLKEILGGDFQGQAVVDAGCGTGILSILAAMRGARNVLAYDIDSWSVDNARRNLALNRIDTVDVRHGDASTLDGAGTFDVVLANINRNILLQDIPRFARAMHAGSRLYLSGFYTADVPLLCATAAKYNLLLAHQQEEEGWAALMFLSSVDLH